MTIYEAAISNSQFRNGIFKSKSGILGEKSCPVISLPKTTAESRSTNLQQQG